MSSSVFSVTSYIYTSVTIYVELSGILCRRINIDSKEFCVTDLVGGLDNFRGRNICGVSLKLILFPDKG